MTKGQAGKKIGLFFACVFGDQDLACFVRLNEPVCEDGNNFYVLPLCEPLIITT